MPRTATIANPTDGATVHPDLTTGHNGPNREDFLFYAGQVDQIDDQQDALRKRRNAVRRAAKNAGIELKDMDWARAQRDFDPETVADEFKRRAQYAAWFDLAAEIPTDLFAAADKRASTEDLTEQAKRDGYERGVAGDSMDEQKWLPMTPEGQAYAAAWHEGQKVNFDKLRKLNADMAAAEKAKAAKAAKNAKAAKAAKNAKAADNDDDQHPDPDAQNGPDDGFYDSKAAE